MTLARDWSAAVRPETADKLHHYWASLALLESLLDDDPLVSQLRFELEALATLPPRTPGRAPGRSARRRRRRARAGTPPTPRA